MRASVLQDDPPDDFSGAQFVDASSGVEDAPGRKSPDKIAAFVTAARNAPYTNIAGAA